MKLKYISLNIWFGGHFFDEILDFIKKEDPDIISFQEVYNGVDPKLERNYRTLEIYKKVLDAQYFYFEPSFLEITPIGKIDIGNAIFSKFPILRKDVTFYDRPYSLIDIGDIPNRPFMPRNLLHATIDLGKTIVNVFTTHGVWGFDDKDNELRLHMSKVIVEKVKDIDNVILSGDFNVDQNTDTIRNIEKHLNNIFKGELKTSFNTEIKKDPGFAKSVVDFVFVSKNIRVLEHYCPQVKISDHMPLVSVLDIN